MSANGHLAIGGSIELSWSVVERYDALYALGILPRVAWTALIRTVTGNAERILNIKQSGRA